MADIHFYLLSLLIMNTCVICLASKVVEFSYLSYDLFVMHN